MTVDELIDELNFLKQTYPDCGRLKVLRTTKKSQPKELHSLEKRTKGKYGQNTLGVFVNFKHSR